MLFIGDVVGSVELLLSRGVTSSATALCSRPAPWMPSRVVRLDEEAIFEEFDRRYREACGAALHVDGQLSELPDFSAVFVRAGVSR